MAAAVLRYVALGDSYTIGTAVRPPERWPDQLVARLGEPGYPPLVLAANLAVNGSTSAGVIGHQMPLLDRLFPEFVSLLVGVNDVVQRVSEATYRANAARILEALLARLPPGRILAVGTPDYTVTPAGTAYGDPATLRSGIQRVNAVLAELAAARGVAFVDVFDLSQAAAMDRALVAGDGLHPSGAQYARWVERIAPVVAALLSRP